MPRDIPDEMYEDDIEEIEIETDSDESMHPPGTKSEKCSELQVHDNDLEYTYRLLQTIIQKREEPPKVLWKRTETVEKALSVCKELAKEEFVLKSDIEQLFQQNWKLRKRVQFIEKAKRKKKRKANSVTSRRASEVSPGSHKSLDEPKRRISMDDSKVQVANSKTEDNIVKKTESSVSIKSPKNPKRKSKKHSGMTEEEKEFCSLEEKIEDLLYEVNTLWNEVKDDSDVDEKEDISGKNNDQKPVEEQMDLLRIPNVNTSKNIPETNSGENESKNKKLCLKSISKLIDPQFISQNDGQQRPGGVGVLKTKKNLQLKPQPSTNTEKFDLEQKKPLRKPVNISSKNFKKILHKATRAESDVIIISEGSDSEPENTSKDPDLVVL